MNSFFNNFKFLYMLYPFSDINIHLLLETPLPDTPGGVGLSSTFIIPLLIFCVN